MKRFVKSFGLTVVGVILAILIAVSALGSSIVQSAKREREQVRERLVDLTRVEIDYVNAKIEDIMQQSRSLALAVEKFDDITAIDSSRMFQDIIKNSGVTDIFLTTPDGSVYFADAAGLELAFRLDISRCLLGDDAVSEVCALSDGRNVFSVSCPVVRKGEVIGVVTGVYDTELFAGIVAIPSFGDQGYMHIFQKNGTFVAKSSNAMTTIAGDSFFSIEVSDFAGGYSMAQLLDDIGNNGSGFLEYTLGGMERYAYYAPVGWHGWYVVTVVPMSVINRYADDTSRAQTLLSLEISAAILILLAFVIIDGRNRRRDLRLANDRLNLSEGRFRVAISHVSYLVFEYDFALGYITILTDPDDDALLRGKSVLNLEQFAEFTHPDDMETLQSLIADAESGTPEKNALLRLQSGETGNYRWYNLILSSILDSSRRPLRAIGTLEDITDQRAETLQLRERADTDPLTGVYNRAANERMISAVLTGGESSDQHAFMVIDLDDFKRINDSLGHLAGDEVLRNVTGALSSAFRNTDIISRLGGDEFSVFLKGVANIEIIRRKLKKPLLMLAKPTAARPMPVTLSIGVAFGSSADKFNELYRKADIALYKAKQDGKNQITVYSDDLEPNRTEKTAIGSALTYDTEAPEPD